MSNALRLVLVGCLLSSPFTCTANDVLTFAGVKLVGTARLSPDDVARGLGLTVGQPTTRQNLVRACGHFNGLKLFDSSLCRYTTDRKEALLVIKVKDRSGTPVVFDNFFWMTRAQLLARLKQQIPLFMKELPIRCGLMNDICRALEGVALEHGIKSRVTYDARWWTERGLNVFYMEGILTPVDSLIIEGENAPTSEELQKWAQFYTKENFSAARLTWIIGFVIRDFYYTRGYLRPVVGRPTVQCLSERKGAFPVRVMVPISSGELYTLGSVSFAGLAKPEAASLYPAWKLKAGEPYDDSYTDRFVFEHILSAPWAQHSKTESDVAPYCAWVDEVSRKVILTISVETPKPYYRYAKDAKPCGGITKFQEYPPVP